MKTSWLMWILQVGDTTTMGTMGNGGIISPSGLGRGCCHQPQWILEGNDVTGHGVLLEVTTPAAVENPRG